MTPLYQPIDINLGSHYDVAPVVIENTVLYAMEPGLTAITVTFPPAPSIAQTSVIIKNVCIRPGTTQWANGIHLINCWNPIINGVNVYAGQEGALQNGIILNGTTMDARIRDTTIYHPITGVFITGESEGTQISGLTALGCIFGVYASTPGAEAGLFVSDSHIAASRAGIVMHNRPQAFLHDLLIYRHPWRHDGYFDAIAMDEASKDGLNMRNIEVRLP